MRHLVDCRSFLIGMAIVTLLAWGLHAWLNLNFWVCFGIAVFAILINGIIIMFEDDL